MNNIKIKNILGLINFVTCSDDFLDQYDLVMGSNSYFYESMDLSLKYGIALINEKDEKCVNVPISINSYLALKRQCDVKSIHVYTAHSITNVLSNLFSINVVLGFIKDVHDEYFESYILYEKDNKFVCVNMLVSDIFTIKSNVKFPVFINKKIIEKRKIKYSEILENIKIGIWRSYH